MIGAGFGRTGTSSLKDALEILGFGKCYHMKEVIQNGHAAQWLQISETKDYKIIGDLMGKGGYRSTCDHPACMYWQEQLKMYPDAKVILTMRDPNSWYGSWMGTVALLQPDCETCPFGTRVFMGLDFFRNFAKMSSKIITGGSFAGDWSKRNMIKCYRDHVEEVISLCPPEKLLLYHAADGWEPLCTFLGVPVPDRPYPHLNSTREFKLFAFLLNAIGWIVTILGCGIPAIYCIRSKIVDVKKKSINVE